MILYFASINISILPDYSKPYINNILTSFFYKNDSLKLLNEWTYDRLFLDSGAFSAYTQDKTINLDVYAEFIKQYESKITHYANLDVIGDAEKTFENYKLLKAKGLKPMPVYHYGEARSYLKRYIDEGESYIALGGMVGKQNSFTCQLEELFDQYSHIKFHGFGLSNPVHVNKYPWYSVDSSTWSTGARMGHLIADDRQIHYSELTSQERVALLDAFDIPEEMKCKLFEGIGTDYKARNFINILAFKNIEKRHNVKEFKKMQLDLF